MRRLLALACIATLDALALASCAQQPHHSAALDAAVAQYNRMQIDTANK